MYFLNLKTENRWSYQAYKFLEKNIWTVLLTLQICNFIFYIVFDLSLGYLPTPFINDKYDTFMDFFHTAYWSMNSGRYTEWHSVYPPLVFVIAKIALYLDPLAETASNGFSLRSIWPQGIVFLITSYIFSVGLTVALWPDKQPKLRRWFYWTTFFLLSPPALFSLERGNLIFLLPPLIVLSLRSNKFSAQLAEALMINIKPYMVLVTVSYLVKKDFRSFFQVGILSAIIFLSTGFFLDPNFLSFFESFLVFNDVPFQWSPITLLSMVASPAVYAYVNEFRYIVNDDGLSRSAEYVLFSKVPIYLCFLLASVGLFYILKNSRQLNINLIKFYAYLTVPVCVFSAGGYSLLIMFACFHFLSSESVFGKLERGLVVLIFAPLDLLVTRTKIDFGGYSYVSKKFVTAVDFDTIASIARPACLMLILGVVVFKLAKLKLSGLRTVGVTYP